MALPLFDPNPLYLISPPSLACQVSELTAQIGILFLRYLLCGSRSSSPPPSVPPAALQVSELTTQIDGLFLRCFAGLEVEVEAEETTGGRQQQQQEQQQEGEGGRAAAVEAPPPPPPPPRVMERFDSGLTEAQFGELGRTRPKVGPRLFVWIRIQILINDSDLDPDPMGVGSMRYRLSSWLVITAQTAPMHCETLFTDQSKQPWLLGL